LTRTRRAGFTLIELLIVVAIIGMIAAILIPNMIEAMQKGRQKRTLADLRHIGLGLTQYWTDRGGAAAAGQQTVDISEWEGDVTPEDLGDALVPDYMPHLPLEDGWGFEIEYRIRLADPPATRYALIRAQGSDGEFSGDSYESGQFAATDYGADIVWADGAFLRAPAITMDSGS
jgi:general secretion pathway protein G